MVGTHSRGLLLAASLPSSPCTKRNATLAGLSKGLAGLLMLRRLGNRLLAIDSHDATRPNMLHQHFVQLELFLSSRKKRSIVPQLSCPNQPNEVQVIDTSPGCEQANFISPRLPGSANAGADEGKLVLARSEHRNGRTVGQGPLHGSIPSSHCSVYPVLQRRLNHVRTARKRDRIRYH